MNEEAKAVEAAKAAARPEQEKGEAERKTYHKPELKRQGGMAQVTGFTF